MRERIDRYLYYWLVGIVSFLTLSFLPFIGSKAGIGLQLPDSTAGWIVFIITKLLVAGLNVLIFHCFVQQAEINVRDDPKYKEASEILQLIDDEEEVWLSPKEFYRKEYRSKGISIVITSILGAFGLTQAILTWDGITFLTYLFTILICIIFSILAMLKFERYLTYDRWKYAKKIAEAQKNLKSEMETDNGNTINE